MNGPAVVGLQPWLPWPLSRSAWWTTPVRAERLAALRMGVAAMLLLDVSLTYLPNLGTFFGEGSLGDPKLYARMTEPPRWHWSLLRSVTDREALRVVMHTWQVAILFLLVGVGTRLNAVVVWALSVSFATLNPDIENGGDQVRSIMLFYLMLCPCGAAWSVDSWLRRRGQPDTGSVHVHPWPLRLLFVQMALIYCTNGLYKLKGHDWPLGRSLYYILADATLTRWSYADLTIPYAVTQVMTWTVLTWEVSFPLLVALPGIVAFLTWPFPAAGWVEALRVVARWMRICALWFGVLFHIGIGASMELGFFTPYMLCLYLPLVPWERWVDPRRQRTQLNTAGTGFSTAA